MLDTNADDVADGLIDEMEDYADEVEEEIDRALREAKELARQRAPVDTGRLRNSVSVDLEQDMLYSNVEYAVYQDLGTIYIEPTFFMRDSALNAWQNSIERLQSR